MVNSWYWPKHWAAPSEKNKHSDKYRAARENEITVQLRQLAGSCPKCARNLSPAPSNDLDVYTIKYNGELNMWQLSGPRLEGVDATKRWLSWFAAKELRKLWEKDCYQARLDVYKSNGEFQRSTEYGTNL